jgi:hypothetical protein
MSQTPSSATSPQLTYLRSLAVQTGTTFSPPKTRADASKEIRRLLKLKSTACPGDFAELEEVEAPVYATAAQADEITGHGSTTRWKTTPPPKSERSHKRPASGALTEVGRYEITEGERVICGQRTNGRVTLKDTPAEGEGRTYVIERDLQDDGYSALKALVADYIEQALELDRVPMASSVIRRSIEAENGE